ncbi:hypothetical protein FH972_012738 [Carpinus fangiana]|uniref:Uncharacterized protein n=1 Tax=Carpinus fangiana TaxID=176857 RepID=A0A5N6R4M3_9ROSI|nr:hypothetical protein FH972_012738 [Carpinus fangiana]
MGKNIQALLVKPLTLPLSTSQYIKVAIWLPSIGSQYMETAVGCKPCCMMFFPCAIFG